MSRIFKIVAVAIFFAVFSGCGVGNEPRNMSADAAAEFMATEKNYLIVDVRSQAEYDKRHIPGAVLVPVDDLRAGNFSALPDKNKTLLIYCWTGRRAGDAASILAKAGYKNVYNFGGLVDWNGDTIGAED